MLLPLLAFVFGSLVVTAITYALTTRSAGINDRLRDIVGGVPPAAAAPDASSEQIAAFFKRIGERVPRSPKELGKIQLRLVQAGYRGGEALPVFLGIRIAFMLGCATLCLTPLVGRPGLLAVLPALGLGYLIPGMVLARKAKRRQHRIRLSLADALDLLVVSVEAGLGLDQALARVGQELEFAYPDLSSELRLVSLELLAGTGRSNALKNLADRTGVDDLSSLVAMLVQTDKFGTSVADSLRVYSDTLRTKRRQRAEEAAAKTGVKMVFPLVLCIFPAIWIVTIGPAAIRFIKVLVPLTSGMK
ncbi:MAG TPA: type II secretion system F family protein [Vicinamibacterales bacterium]|nr:type II secretion system F family protein [Vicinamibacterales bacterium]